MIVEGLAVRSVYALVARSPPPRLSAWSRRLGSLVIRLGRVTMSILLVSRC